MASTSLTNLRSSDPSANRQTDAISRLVEPVCRAVMGTPIMGAAPPPWVNVELLNGFAWNASLGLRPRYHRDALGYVHAQVSVLAPGGALAGATIFVLPKGYLPSALVTVPAFTLGGGAGMGVQVSPTGACMLAINGGAFPFVLCFALDFLAEA